MHRQGNWRGRAVLSPREEFCQPYLPFQALSTVSKHNHYRPVLAIVG